MSLISALNIPFKPSKDYQRLLVVIYSLTLWSVFDLNYPFWLILYLCIGILVHGYHLFKMGRPYARYRTLAFQNKQWHLIDELGREVLYQDMQILYDLHFVICLMLTQHQPQTKKRRLIFFGDQLTDEIRRELYLLQLENAASNSYTIFEKEPAE